MTDDALRQATADLIGGFVCLAASLAIFAFALAYTGTAGLFPRLVAGFTVALCLLDIAVSYRAHRRAGSDEHGFAAALSGSWPHMQAILWLALFVSAIWVLGLHLGIILAAALFMRVKGRFSVVKSLLFGLCLGLALYLVFGMGLGVRMYPGLAFGRLL